MSWSFPVFAVVSTQQDVRISSPYFHIFYQIQEGFIFLFKYSFSPTVENFFELGENFNFHLLLCQSSRYESAEIFECVKNAQKDNGRRENLLQTGHFSEVVIYEENQILTNADFRKDTKDEFKRKEDSWLINENAAISERFVLGSK